MVTHLTIKRSLLALSVAAGLSIVPTGTWADNSLQSEMDKLFNEMSNFTPPGVFESQRRGVLSGGRYTTKSRIFDENIVGFAPPSWKGGCGGVDLFGGSLSFINADQIVQLLRSVAANAKGYAFQLALDNVFPTGSKWIENFQKKVQSLNEHLGNSCQLAQGAVNNLTSGMDLKHKTDASLTGTASGLFDDFFGSKQETGGKTPMEELKTHKTEEYDKLIGNIVWEQLKENNVDTWFTYGDTNLLETIMSLTGTIIVGDLIDDPNAPEGTGSKTNPLTTLPSKDISLSVLITGGPVEIYSCGSDLTNCLIAATESKSIDIKGLQTQINDLLLGTESSPGVIFKYANNAGTLSDPEKAFVSNLPGGLGTIVRNLSVLSPDAARLFVSESSGSIALIMMHNFTQEFLRAARIALASSKSPYLTKVQDLLNDSARQLSTEYTMLTSVYGDLAHQIEKYNNLLENIRKQRYMLATLSNPPSTN